LDVLIATRFVNGLQDDIGLETDVGTCFAEASVASTAVVEPESFEDARHPSVDSCQLGEGGVGSWNGHEDLLRDGETRFR